MKIGENFLMECQIENKQWIYQHRPKTSVGFENYELKTQLISTQLAHNEVLLEAMYFSVDPYMRIQQSSQPTWEAPHALGAVQGGGVVGKIKKTNNPNFREGDWVYAYSGWQTYARVHASELTKLDPTQAPVTTALSVLGMPGRTAWFGLTEAGQPKPGDVVVISGAAGAVGSLVVQFAKLQGAKVVAIAGSSEKCRWLIEELGADFALNYKDYKDSQALLNKLKEICGGIDVYFDNVGGWITDAVLPIINKRARLIICGQISQYNGGLDMVEQGPRFLHHLIYQRATIQGILARDYIHRHSEMIQHVAPLLKSGKLKYQETFVEGFEQLPQALNMLFTGDNIGKMIVKSTSCVL